MKKTINLLSAATLVCVFESSEANFIEKLGGLKHAVTNSGIGQAILHSKTVNSAGQALTRNVASHAGTLTTAAQNAVNNVNVALNDASLPLETRSRYTIAQGHLQQALRSDVTDQEKANSVAAAVQTLKDTPLNWITNDLNTALNNGANNLDDALSSRLEQM